MKTVPSIGSLVVMMAAVPKDSGAPAGSTRLQFAGPLRAIFRSPRWQLASAQMKDAVQADAIMKGDPERVSAALGRIAGSAAPSREASITIRSDGTSAIP